MFNEAEQLHYTGRSEVWRERVESLRVYRMKALSYGAVGAGLMMSKPKHERPVGECLARVQFWQEDGN